MSWAARRQTTRVEDSAYCLLGLFEVNMPLLYGEGQKAFLRLQQEIIKQSDDQSIFAWCQDLENYAYQAGVLAQRASFFQYSSQVRRLDDRPDHPYSITNLGLHMRARSYQLAIGAKDHSCLPHFVPLASVELNHTTKISQQPTREIILRPGHTVYLVLLQCLHDNRRTWIRSYVGDLLLRGQVSEKVCIRLLEDQQAEEVEIYAPLSQNFVQLCADCWRFDTHEFTPFIKSLASQ
jgi:hypothetical protein